MQPVRPASSGFGVRVLRRGADAAARAPRLRAALLHPAVARPGYWVVTAAALLWGAVLSVGHIETGHGLIVTSGCPPWAFGRGGTTIGAVYLTRDNVSPLVLEHEAVHRAQWRTYGLVFIPLYLAAGSDARSNRFEVEAGLREGGYA
jgi:hypothetical protein